MLALWKAAFGKDLAPGVWRWKYHDPPEGSNVMACIDDTGAVAAMFGGVCYPAHLQGKRVEINQLMDNMSHPDYRGAGVFVRTVQHFFDSFTGPEASILLYGFPGRYHFEIGKKYCRYKELGSGVRYLTADLSDAPSKPKNGSDHDIDLETVIDKRFDQLWKVCCSDYPFAAIRDSRFLRWRFLDHPIRKYDIWGYHPDGAETVGGYGVVLQQESTAILVDLLIPRSEEKIRSFIRQLMAALRKKGIKGIRTWLPAAHFLSASLISCGFTPLSEPLGVIPTARVFDPNLSFEWVDENLYYTMGDADLY